MNMNSLNDAGAAWYGGFAPSALLHKATSFGADRYRYNQQLDAAKRNYEQRVEKSHQELNDYVEAANRQYEDALINASRA